MTVSGKHVGEFCVIDAPGEIAYVDLHERNQSETCRGTRVNLNRAPPLQEAVHSRWAEAASPSEGEHATNSPQSGPWKGRNGQQEGINALFAVFGGPSDDQVIASADHLGYACSPALWHSRQQFDWPQLPVVAYEAHL